MSPETATKWQTGLPKMANGILGKLTPGHHPTHDPLQLFCHLILPAAPLVPLLQLIQNKLYPPALKTWAVN